jgi:hypothetical protein
MLLIFFVVIAFVSGSLLAIEGMKNGLGKKRWFFAGLVFGPTVWPMLNVKKQMKIRKHYGFNVALLRA